ncbi:MAG: substrate-binding domain-containing protein, partial [Umezawaea sp.]
SGLVAAGDGVRPGQPAVGIDQRGGAAAATRHLLELGHRTVHHLAGPRGWLDAEWRTEGWRAVLDEAGRRVPEPVAGHWSAGSGYAAMREVLATEPGVSAVFAANVPMALCALRALDEAGLRVPEDVSVVGFDDVPEAAYFIPPLTTIRPDFEAVARATLGMLLGQIESGTPTATRHTIAPALVVRDSVAPPAGR